MTEPSPKPKLVTVAEPWPPGQATERIRFIACEDSFSPVLTRHAEDRMEERDITALDVMHVLQNGIVLEAATPSTRPSLYKYAIVCSTPNSNRREVKVIVIPSIQAAAAKIVTVMWADEK